MTVPFQLYGHYVSRRLSAYRLLTHLRSNTSHLGQTPVDLDALGWSMAPKPTKDAIVLVAQPENEGEDASASAAVGAATMEDGTAERDGEEQEAGAASPPTSVRHLVAPAVIATARSLCTRHMRLLDKHAKFTSYTPTQPLIEHFRTLHASTLTDNEVATFEKINATIARARDALPPPDLPLPAGLQLREFPFQEFFSAYCASVNDMIQVLRSAPRTGVPWMLSRFARYFLHTPGENRHYAVWEMMHHLEEGLRYEVWPESCELAGLPEDTPFPGRIWWDGSDYSDPMPPPHVDPKLTSEERDAQHAVLMLGDKAADARAKAREACGQIFDLVLRHGTVDEALPISLVQHLTGVIQVSSDCLPPYPSAQRALTSDIVDYSSWRDRILQTGVSAGQASASASGRRGRSARARGSCATAQSPDFRFRRGGSSTAALPYCRARGDRAAARG